MASEVKLEEATLNLTAPDPVPVVAPDKAAGLVPLDEGQKTKLEARVDGFIAELVAADANSPEFGAKVDAITNMGRKEISEAAGQSNRFLDRPVRSMDETSGVGKDLAELRRVVEDLDPGKRGKLTQRRKLFGLIPFGNRMRDYFDSYKSAQSHIASILSSLASGKDELLKDNAAIAVDDDGVGAAHRSDRRTGADQSAAGAGPDHRAQHDDRQCHRFNRRAAEVADRGDS